MAHHSVWGPSGIVVEQIVRRAATLTEEEHAKLSEAWEDEPDSVDTAWGLVAFAAAASGRPASDAADAAADAAGWSFETRFRRGPLAVADAAYVAAVADMADTGPLKREHIDAIMGPWLQVIGDPRIDPVCECDPPSGTAQTETAAPAVLGPVFLDLGALAPQPGDRFPWLVMAVDPTSPEPLIVGYAEDAFFASELAETVVGPVVMWRAEKEMR